MEIKAAAVNPRVSAASFANDVNLRGMLRLGLINAGTGDQEAFLVWGALVQDPIVKGRACALPHGTVIPGENYQKAIEQMTPTELKELRERVLARIKANGK